MARRSIPKNTVFVYFYTSNEGDFGGYKRVGVFKSFRRAYEEMISDSLYFHRHEGSEVQDEWRNDPDIDNCTAACTTLSFPGGWQMDLNIYPAIPV